MYIKVQVHHYCNLLFIYSGPYVVIMMHLYFDIHLLYCVCQRVRSRDWHLSTETSILCELGRYRWYQSSVLTVGRDPRKWGRKAIEIKILLYPTLSCTYLPSLSRIHTCSNLALPPFDFR